MLYFAWSALDARLDNRENDETRFFERPDNQTSNDTRPKLLDFDEERRI